MRIKVRGNVVAIETGPSVTAGKWFVFDINNGGYYDDGIRENVEGWADATYTEGEPEPAAPPPGEPEGEPGPPEEPREAPRRKASK